MEMAISDNDQDLKDDEDAEVRWNEKRGSSDDSELTYMSIEDLNTLEVNLAYNTFTHELLNSASVPSSYFSADTSQSHLFNGVVIDTAANRRSIMSLNQ